MATLPVTKRDLCMCLLPKAKHLGSANSVPGNSVSQSVCVRVLQDFWKVEVDTGEGESGKTQGVPATGGFQASKGHTHTSTNQH